MSELCDLTILELTTLYQTGTASPLDVMKQVLTRIRTFDPAVNAFCQIADDALDMARASEQELSEYLGVNSNFVAVDRTIRTGVN